MCNNHIREGQYIEYIFEGTREEKRETLATNIANLIKAGGFDSRINFHELYRAVKTKLNIAPSASSCMYYPPTNIVPNAVSSWYFKEVTNGRKHDR